MNEKKIRSATFVHHLMHIGQHRFSQLSINAPHTTKFSPRYLVSCEKIFVDYYFCTINPHKTAFSFRNDSLSI